MNIKQENYYQTFISLYEQKLSDTKIGEILGISSKAVFAYRKRKNLKANIPHKVINVTKFQELYNQKLNDTEIGKILNVSVNTVYSLRSRLKLKSNNPSKNQPIKLTDLQKEILVGTLLGDGYLRFHGYSYSGKIEHSLKQEEYCIWKHQIFKNLVSEIKYTDRIARINNKRLFSVYFCFKANSELKYFYEMFYSARIKQVSKEILQFLSPIAIATWYMDDGTYSNYTCSIATDSLTKESLNILMDFLLNQYGIETSITKRNRIYFKAKTRKKFFDLIYPFIHKTLMYKLGNYIPSTVT